MTEVPYCAHPLVAVASTAERIAQAAGLHGAYVRNALARGEGTGFVFDGNTAAAGLCWFGPRGNLVVIAVDGAVFDVEAVAGSVQLARQSWRIAMGPEPVLAALRRRCTQLPLVYREQLYYGGDRTTADRALSHPEVRLAGPADRDLLVQATLQLNQSDLRIEPRRVDRRWLYETVDARIADGTTWVLGPPGAFVCKLDIGSDGPAGIIIEGVFTFANARGRGHAATLVAACMLAAPGPVALHVAAGNAAARAAYERAGMRAVGGCQLLLIG